MDVKLLQDNPPVICVDGEVDLGNVDALISAIDLAVPKAPQGLIIDMAQVVYIDSAGIQAVLSAYQQLRRSDGILVLVLGNPDVRTIFSLIHPEMLPGFLVVDDIEAARQAFPSPPG